MNLFKKWDALHETGKTSKVVSGDIIFDLRHQQHVENLVELHNVQVKALEGITESLKTQLDGLQFALQANQSQPSQDYDDEAEYEVTWKSALIRIVLGAGWLIGASIIYWTLNYKEFLQAIRPFFN